MNERHLIVTYSTHIEMTANLEIKNLLFELAFLYIFAVIQFFLANPNLLGSSSVCLSIRESCPFKQFSFQAYSTMKL